MSDNVLEKIKEIYLPFFQEENTYFKIDENDGFKIIIKQRLNEQIICGSTKSKNGLDGQVKFFEKNPKVLLKYVGISCTVKTWIIVDLDGNCEIFT